MHIAFLPFRLQPPNAPYHRFITLPLSLIGFLLVSKVWASPFTSPKTSEVLKTSSVTVILIHPHFHEDKFWQYFEALFLVKTCFLTSHLEKYSTPDRFIRGQHFFR